MYFLVKGEAGFVLPRYENLVYEVIKKGDHFGHIDLGEHSQFADLGSVQMSKKKKLKHSDFHLNKDHLIRRFTV